MKVIIAGSRTLFGADLIESAVNKSGFDVGLVISGGASGIDQSAEAWAETSGIPTKVFHADWTKYGKSAGVLRNRKMAEFGDALIAIWDGKSNGTRNMIDEARKLDLVVFVYLVRDND